MIFLRKTSEKQFAKLSCLIVIMTILSIDSYAQSPGFRVFRVTQYINGDFYRQTNDTLKLTSEPIDIYVFSRHFYYPYYLPEKFIDKQKRNRTVSIWRDPKGKKNFQENWEKTYTYDSLGRVITYTYSGCVICSNLPYSYTVDYTSVGQVERIVNSLSSEDSYRFYYDKNGNIVKLEKYVLDRLEEVVERVD